MTIFNAIESGKSGTSQFLTFWIIICVSSISGNVLAASLPNPKTEIYRSTTHSGAHVRIYQNQIGDMEIGVRLSGYPSARGMGRVGESIAQIILLDGNGQILFDNRFTQSGTSIGGAQRRYNVTNFVLERDSIRNLKYILIGGSSWSRPIGKRLTRNITPAFYDLKPILNISEISQSLFSKEFDCFGKSGDWIIWNHQNQINHLDNCAQISKDTIKQAQLNISEDSLDRGATLYLGSCILCHSEEENRRPSISPNLAYPLPDGIKYHGYSNNCSQCKNEGDFEEAIQFILRNEQNRDPYRHIAVPPGKSAISPTIRDTQQARTAVPQTRTGTGKSGNILSEIEVLMPSVHQQTKTTTATSSTNSSVPAFGNTSVLSTETTKQKANEIVPVEIGRFANSSIREDRILFNTFSSVLSYQVGLDSLDIEFYALIDTRVTKSNIPAKFLMPPYTNTGIIKLNLGKAATRNFKAYDAEVGGIAFTTSFEGQSVELAFPYEALLKISSDGMDDDLLFQNGVVVEPTAN